MPVGSDPASANTTKGGAVLAILAAAMFVSVIGTDNRVDLGVGRGSGQGENEAMAETVRNPTIPGVQLELDDLPKTT